MRAARRLLGLSPSLLGVLALSACVAVGDQSKPVTAEGIALAWSWIPDPPPLSVVPADELTVALQHLNGIGVERDLALAEEHLRRAAELGNGTAAYLMARLHEEGIGRPADPDGATEWLERAAELGHPEAQYRLGMAYYRGEGRPLNTVAGVRWFRQAANSGNAEAQYNLGLAYQFGRGTYRDEIRSVQWLERAAEQDHAMAQYLTGDAYSDGRGVEVDDSWAARWYGRAAWLGLPRAQYKLALFYFSGNGVPRDHVQAYKWARLAAGGGGQNAVDLLELLKQSLSENELRYGQALAAAWRPPMPRDRTGGAYEPDRAAIEFAQFALAELGYDPGPVDGHLGPKTLQALAVYGERKGVGAHGPLSPELLRHLKDDRLARRLGS